jgi:hypothetical protein
MTPQGRLGDRREHLRFEVAGQLWASIDFGEQVVLRNIATGGALVETNLTCVSKPIRAAQLAFEQRGDALNVIVRHVSPLTEPPDASTRFLVGLEFVNVTAAQRLEIERLVDDWHARSNS